MSNRLQYESSPYLLQHKDNPVDWYPWGEEAFAKAAAENKPVFLSIGYSTCHWCHVMARESFENPTIADYLNDHFVSIKVDREERPDIDSVYMQAVLAYTGQGGWPMSVFLTPDKKPFFAGTYFPIRSNQSTPGFYDLIRAIGLQWEHDSDALLDNADALTDHVKRMAGQSLAEGDLPLDEARLLPDLGAAMFQGMYDPEYGGFGQAPKFPSPHNLLFLLAYGAFQQEESSKRMAEHTLVQMRKGGIFDQVGGGFSRYSTDPYFLAPHFEKMLYDNALLTMAYTAASVVTKNAFYLTVAQETADYVLWDLVSPEGLFYSAQDADSDGEEGKFYTFSYDELLEFLGNERGALFADSFGVTEEGNFQDTNILNMLHFTEEDPADLLSLKDLLQPELDKLLEYRKTRTALHTDTKVLVSWNALMVVALAMLARALRSSNPERAEHYQTVAETAVVQLIGIAEEKQSQNLLFLDDAAFLAMALLELYHTTLNEEYLAFSKVWAEKTIALFGTKANNGTLQGFTLSAATQTELFLNPTETYDGAIPSGNAVMAYNLVRVAQLTGEEKLEQLAKEQLSYLAACSKEHPTGHAMYLLAQLLYDNPPPHITVVPGPDFLKQEFQLETPFLADVVITEKSEHYILTNNLTTYYVCKGKTCYSPTNQLSVT